MPHLGMAIFPTGRNWTNLSIVPFPIGGDIAGLCCDGDGQAGVSSPLCRNATLQAWRRNWERSIQTLGSENLESAVIRCERIFEWCRTVYGSAHGNARLVFHHVLHMNTYDMEVHL